MNLKHALGAAALLASASSFGLTLQGGNAGNLDNRTEGLAGLHLADSAGFIDFFEFSVSAPGVAAAVFFDSGFDSFGNPALAFTFNTLLLVDAANVPLPGAAAVDIDGSDGWSVAAALPSAGLYRVVLGGAAPPPGADGEYFLGAVSANVPIPEPATYGLMALGLALLGAFKARTSKS